MNKSKITTIRSLTTVEKIRAYRDKLYDRYMSTHKKLDVHCFYEEMIKDKKCTHTVPKTA